MDTRTCNNCGWVAFGVTREHAQAEVDGFNKMMVDIEAAGDINKIEFWGGPGRRSSITSYERCMLCNGPHTNFRDSKPDDCPEGCTINPIIVE